MKKIYLVIISLCFTLMLEAQVSKTVVTTAGKLYSLLTKEELNTLTDLTITGTMDARDFKTIRDKMPLLAVLNLSKANITAYSGMEGTDEYFTDYRANAIPPKAFVYIDQMKGKISLTSILLPESITSIGYTSFAFCTGLTTIEIPPTVTSIEASVFYNCRNLTSINIPSTITSIESGLFFGCIGLTSIDIPSSVTSIASSAFYGCKNLISLTIPPAVTSIESMAFYNCMGLTSITIPSTITIIGNFAFSNCSGLTSIFSNLINPPDLINIWEVFSDIDKTRCTLHVPLGSKNRYAVAHQWKDFINIVEDPVGVHELKQDIDQFKCYPNPFTTQVNIEIQNPKQLKLAVDIYNMSGQKVKNLAYGIRTEKITLTWDGNNEKGQQVVNGMYLMKVNEKVMQIVKGR